LPESIDSHAPSEFIAIWLIHLVMSVVYLKGIRSSDEVREQIRRLVERTKRRHRVRNLDGLEGMHTL